MFDHVTDRVNARFENSQPISVGRIVHVPLDKVDPYTGEPVIRPALVVRAWNNGCLNLQVFYDGSNDNSARGGVGVRNLGSLTEWKTSVTYDAGELREIDDPAKPGEKKTVTIYNPHTWHWPPRA